ncbi:hypothetical protein AAC387_Pa02g2194 [Persea americana]
MHKPNRAHRIHADHTRSIEEGKNSIAVRLEEKLLRMHKPNRAHRIHANHTRSIEEGKISIAVGLEEKQLVRLF